MIKTDNIDYDILHEELYLKELQSIDSKDFDFQIRTLKILSKIDITKTYNIISIIKILKEKLLQEKFINENGDTISLIPLINKLFIHETIDSIDLIIKKN